MNTPCKVAITCPGPQPGLDGDFPITNYTAELPDTVSFEGAGFTYPIFNQNNTIGGDNTTGNFPAFFADAGCLSLCVSFLSQDDANACAARQAFMCAHTPPTGPPPTFFFNQQQSASFVCPDGSIFTFTVLPGYFVALSLADANELAFALALERAIQNHVCMGPLTTTGQVGVPYSSTMTLYGNFPIGVGIVSGQLPPGLVLSQDPAGKTLTVSGTPNTPGTFNFALMATDPFGNFTVRSYTITVTSTCSALWNALASLWQPSTIGPGSQAFINGTTVTILADGPTLALGFAQLQAIGNAPLAQALTCSITAIQIQNSNPPPPINQSLALFVKDANSNTFFLNVNVNGNALPIRQTFTFTIPKGITPVVGLAALTEGPGGPDSILEYIVTLNPS